MISLTTLYDAVFLFYFSTIMAHSSGSGLDHMLSLTSFGMVALVFLYGILKRRKLRFDFVNTSMLLFLIVVCASYLWAEYPSFVFSPKYSNILSDGPQMMLVSLAISQRVKSKEDVIRFYKIFLIAVAYMLVTIVARTPVWYYTSGKRIGTVTGLWVNSLAQIYAIVLAFLFYFLSTAPQRKKKYYLLFIVVLGLFTLLTGSKNGILMFVAITLLTYFFHGNFTGKVKIIVLSAILGSLILFLIFNVQMLYDIIGYRMDTFIDVLLTGDLSQDSSTNTRSELMGFAWKMFKERPLLGWGFANVAAYVARQGYFIVTYAHSNYLELLADVGLAGTLIFYAPHIVTVCRLIKRVFMERKKDMLSCMALALMLVILITDYASVNITTIYYLSVIQLLYYQTKYAFDDSGNKL